MNRREKFARKVKMSWVTPWFADALRYGNDDEIVCMGMSVQVLEKLIIFDSAKLIMTWSIVLSMNSTGMEYFDFEKYFHQIWCIQKMMWLSIDDLFWLFL